MNLRRCKRNPTIRLEVESEINLKGNEQNLARTFDLFAVSEKNPINQIKGKRTGKHVAIDIPENPMRRMPYLIKVPQLLQKHFKFMYKLGILPSKYDGTKLSGMAYIIQKVLFWILSTLSIIDAIRVIKLFSISYLHEGNLFKHTASLYAVLKAFIRLNFLYLLIWDQDKIKNIHKTINSLAHSLENVVIQDYALTKQERWILACVWTFTFIGSFVLAIFGNITISSDWSFGEEIKLKAFGLSEVLFIWTLNSTAVKHSQEVLFDKYIDNASEMTILLGMLCAVLEFVGYVFENAVDDLFLLTAFTFQKLMSDFQFEKILPDNLTNQSELVWKHYRILQNISKDIELAFGSFLKITHFRNLSRSGYYLLMLTTDASFVVDSITFTLSILKVAATYYAAAKASGKNKDFRKWIQRTYLEHACITVGSKHLKTSLILDELALNPIGMGSGNFHIDESFSIKFTGLVVSYFMFLTDSKEKSFSNSQ